MTTNMPLWKRALYRCFGEYNDPQTLQYGKPALREAQYYASSVFKLFLSEYFGTFALVFCVSGIGTVNAFTVQSTGLSNLEQSVFEVDNVSVGLVHGFILCGLIYAFGDISGAHLNPGVTLALFLAGKFHFLKVPLFWLAQFAGAFTASGIMLAIFGNVGALGANIPRIPSRVRVFGLELVLVTIFFFVILKVADTSSLIGKHAGLAVGLTFVATVLVAGPISTVSFNIARSIAPASVSGNRAALDALWAYVTASLVAAALAAILSRLLKVPQGEKPPLAKMIDKYEGKNAKNHASDTLPEAILSSA